MTSLEGSRASDSSGEQRTRILAIALLILIVLLGGLSAYQEVQNASISSTNGDLQARANNLQQNLSALSSQLSKPNLQHGELVVKNASLANQVIVLNSSLLALAEKVGSLHFLANRTVIGRDVDVDLGPWTSFSTAPPETSVTNFTAEYAGYIIVTVEASGNVGELFLVAGSSPGICAGDAFFCVTGSSPNILAGDSVLFPVLPGLNQVWLGNFSNSTVSASVTVEYYD